MNSIPNRFKQQLQAGVAQVGCWCMSASATLAEAMSYAGYDFLVLDLEHGPGTLQDAMASLRSIEPTATLPVVRMASHDATAIKQILDMGAHSLCFPFVETREEAERIVEAAMYPPDGKRGFARMHRASRYASIPDYTEVANEAVCLVAQLETPGALERAIDIGGVDGIDAVFVGPGDLSAAMGLPGQVAHADVRAGMAECAQACRAASIPIGTIMPSPEDAHWAFGAGFGFVSLGTDLSNLMNSCRDQLRAIRALQEQRE